MLGLWSEEFRPDTLAGYVFKSDSLKEKVEQWIKDGAITHMTLCGPPGTGKTTLAFLMLKELEVDECDILYISASVNNGIDYIREKVVGFAETMPFGEFKYVILDEADYITHNGQAALRGIMQDYSETCRFILTCNYVAKIKDAVLSRCPPITIDSLNMAEYKARAAEILMKAGISLTEDDLSTIDGYAEKLYPDLRKCINCMQQSSIGNKLMPYDDTSNGSEEGVFIEMANLFKAGKFKESRELICKQLSPDQYVNAYRFMYDNLDMFARDEDHEFQCIIIIRDGLVDHSRAADPEICLSGTLAKIFIS